MTTTREHLANLIISGAVLTVPGEPIHLIAATAWRDDEPWQVGRWIADQLTADDRFQDMLLVHHTDDDVNWLRINPFVFGPHADKVFHLDVADRLQDLLDLIDNHWTRMHPAPATSIGMADTGSFKFMAVGVTPEQARAAVMQAWDAHVELTGADPDYLRPDEVDVLTGPPGQTWRDGSPFPRKD
jgi:hypothetical protein